MGVVSVVPFFPCASDEATIDFLTTLGFEVTYHQTEPYLSLAVQLGDLGLQYVDVPDGQHFANEPGGCLVLVDDIAEFHASFTAAMRRRYGRVLADGRPRMTRLRTGQFRFQIIDPTGNHLLFVNRDEPTDLDYGGSVRLQGLAREIDNARILRDFKLDDELAVEALDAGLQRYRENAVPLDIARALAIRAELAVALGQRDHATRLAADIAALHLSPEQHDALRADIESAAALMEWLDG